MNEEYRDSQGRRWVKLRTGEGQHYDREIGLHIRNREKAPLPVEPLPAGGLTARRLNVGGLVYCRPPDDELEMVEVEPEDAAPTGVQRSETGAAPRLSQNELEAMTVAALREHAERLGIEVPAKIRKDDLIEMILDR